MNNRERFRAILHYEKYDRMPVLHFGYWGELLDKWLAEGHITEEERRGYGDGNALDRQMNERLGFDSCYTAACGGNNALAPRFEHQVLERFGDYTYISCRLETGRTHQIRVHMASIRHPLLGDTVYGPQKCPFKLQGQTLHAKILGITHPTTGEYMEFDAPLPEYFEDLLGRMRQNR